MAEMTRRERILAASRRQIADRLPFFHNWRHSASRVRPNVIVAIEAWD